MNEYLRKSVADRRTGANLIGINVDISNMTNVSPDFKVAFNELEKFAAESDEMKIETEKKRILLDIAQSRLDFKEQYLKDNTVYNSQEKWDEANKQYENLRRTAGNKIMNSKYLSMDEKTLYFKKIKYDFSNDWLEHRIKRNSAVTQARVNDVMTNIDMISTIASMGNLYDDDLISNAMTDITTEFQRLIKNGIQTEDNLRLLLAGEMAKIESSLFKRQIEEGIISNSNLTPEQKISEIKKATDYMIQDERVTEVVEDMAKNYNFSDRDKQYFSWKMKERYSDIRETSNKLINKLTKKEEREKKIYETDVVDAINLENPEKLANLTLNDKYGTTDFLGNRDDVLEKLTNSDINNFYDMDNSDFFPVLTSGYFTKISRDKEELEKNGYRGRQALQPLYDMVDNLSGGDKDKKTMIYKHYGYKTGLNPYALYKGEDDPDYIEATEGLRAGGNYIENNDYHIDSEVVGTNAMGKLDAIALNFTKTNSVVGRERALRFVLGVLYNNDLTKKKIEADTDIALKEALNNKETYNRLFELSKKAGTFEGIKIYKSAKLRDPRKEKLLYLKPEKKEEGQIEQQKKENEEKEKKIVENSKGW